MTEQQPAYTPPKKKRSYSLWIAGAVAVVGVLLIVLATPKTPPPDAIDPPECGELIRTVDRENGGKSVAIVQASEARTSTAYTQAIMRVDEVPGWDPPAGGRPARQVRGHDRQQRGCQRLGHRHHSAGDPGRGVRDGVTTGIGGFTWPSP